LKNAFVERQFGLATGGEVVVCASLKPEPNGDAGGSADTRTGMTPSAAMSSVDELGNLEAGGFWVQSTHAEPL
jgi:hypothetical protein